MVAANLPACAILPIEINCNFMLTIRRLLVPVDFSERCLKMMPYVRGFAEKYQAEVILLHVTNPIYTIPETAVSGAIAVPLPERVVEHANQQLDAFAARELAGLTVRRLAYEGDPESQVAETADTEDVQLIMMPTRGHGVFRTFLLGSITSKVLHDVARPILTGAHTDGNHAGAISTIACAIALGPQAHDLLTCAAGLAQDFGAKLAVVRAVQQPDEHGREAIASELNALVANTVTDISVQVQVEHGDPVDAICSFARNAHADLLVIGRGDRQNARLRDHAYAIIRQSPCPVLSI